MASTERIVINGGLVSIEKFDTLYQLPVKDWLEKIERRHPIYSPTLPTGTRSMYWDQTNMAEQKLVMLVEYQPQIMRMDYDGTIKTISVPFTRFFFVATTTDANDNMLWRLTNYRVYWAQQAYRGPDVKDMIPALLPNVYEDGRICFGSTGAQANQSLADRVDQTCNEFFISRFNNDLTIRMPRGLRSYAAWETMTRDNPTGWAEWTDWGPDGRIQPVSYSDIVTQRRLDLGTHDDRFAPMTAAEGIPAVPLGATWGHLEDWMDGPDMDNNTRARLLSLVESRRQTNPEQFVPTVAETI